MFLILLRESGYLPFRLRMIEWRHSGGIECRPKSRSFPSQLNDMLRRLTGKSHPDVLPSLALKDFTRLRLEEVPEKNATFEQESVLPFALSRKIGTPGKL
jgi:hypothetical protein